MDICFYFCRRGGENIHDFKKDTFKLEYNADAGIAYVRKVKDELTKNHRETDYDLITGFMPQLLDANRRSHKMCPVRSFENLLAALNPKIDSLWQQPLKKRPENSNVWFKATPLGHNPLQTFMGKLSQTCELSQHYTNHCIRVTGITNLLRTGKYSPKQVMAITGHKSIHSLSIYQRVKADEKMMMGMTLTYALMNPQEVYQFKLANNLDHNGYKIGVAPPTAALPEPPQAMIRHGPEPLPLPPPVLNQEVKEPLQPHALDSQNNNILPLETALVPFNPAANNANKEAPPQDIDYLEMLCDLDDENENQALMLAAQQVEAQMAGTTRMTTSKTAIQSKKPTVTTFTSCTFGNVGTLNIHIHKH